MSNFVRISKKDVSYFDFMINFKLNILTMQLKKVSLSVMFLAILYSCGNPTDKSDKDKTQNQTVKENVNVPQFNEDSAYSYVDKQVSFGPRVPNSKAHAACSDYLEQKLKNYTENVIVQKTRVRAYDGKALNVSNIIASFKPKMNNRIFLCSHWDSRPISDNDPDPKMTTTPVPGANDGASGVGVLLEIARLLSKNEPKIGVDIIFLDVEDYGQPQNSTFPQQEDTWALGTQYWAKHPHKPDYFAKYGILLDMVGAKGANFLHEGYSMKYAPEVVKNVWSVAQRLGYSSYFVDRESSSVTDDHYYVNTISGIPTIDIIHYDNNSSTGFFPYWHTHNDNMDNISKETLKAVGQTLMTVVFEEK